MANWVHYSSIYNGHPTLSGTAGDLTTLLDAVLINGTTSLSVTSITRSGATATATCAANHGIPTGQTAWRTIAGAGEAEYNGEFLVTSTGAATFTYTVSGSPATPATGTITYKTPGAGWTTAFTATNKRAYYMGSGCVARKYLRINDAAAGTGGAKEALARGFNTMSDIDTGTGPFPTDAQSSLTQDSRVIRKSNTADATTRTWDIWADDRTMILFVQTGDSGTVYASFCFGEYESSATGDTTACLIAGRTQENSNAYTSEMNFEPDTIANGIVGSGTSTGQKLTCGDVNGMNVSTACWIWPGPFMGAAAFASGYAPYPNPLDGGLYMFPCLLYRNNGSSKPSPIGRMRGVFMSLHPAATFTNGDTFNGAGDYAGRSFMVRSVVGNTQGNSQQVFVEHGTNPPAN